MFFLAANIFCLLDSRLDTVSSLETNIIPALEGEINVCVEKYIHTQRERFSEPKLYIVSP